MLSVGQKILNTQINLTAIKGASFDEIEKLALSQMIIEQARDDFLEGRLAFWEYLELCESHELNIDTYLDTVENNLNSIGIIV